MGIQNGKSPNFVNFKTFDLRIPGKKWQLGATPMANHIEDYNRESDGLPQIWVVASLMSPCMPMVHLYTKSAPIMC